MATVPLPSKEKLLVLHKQGLSNRQVAWGPGMSRCAVGWDIIIVVSASSLSALIRLNMIDG